MRSVSLAVGLYLISSFALAEISGPSTAQPFQNFTLSWSASYNILKDIATGETYSGGSATFYKSLGTYTFEEQFCYSLYYPWNVVCVAHDTHVVDIEPSSTLVYPNYDDQIDYSYVLKSGDFNNDGLTDLFIDRTTATANDDDGTIGDMILHQVGGTFVAQPYDAYALQVARTYPINTQVSYELGDFNFDGFADMILSDLDVFLGSGSNKHVVIAPLIQYKREALGVVELTQARLQFTDELGEFFRDTSFFVNSVNLTLKPVYSAQVVCPFVWDPVTYLPSCFPIPTLSYQVTGNYNFNQYAASFANLLWSLAQSGSFQLSDLLALSVQFQGAMGIPAFGYDTSGVIHNLQMFDGTTWEALPEDQRHRVLLQRVLLVYAILLGEDPNPGEAHDTGDINTPICSTTLPECTLENVWCELKKLPAPTDKDETIYTKSDGDVSNVEIGLWTETDDFGNVQHSVIESTRTVINTTQSDHLLHPGQVSRQVVQVGNEIFIRTRGTGTGGYADINTAASGILWPAVDLAISARVASAGLCSDVFP